MCPSEATSLSARQDVLAWVVRGRLLDRGKDAAERGAANLAAAIDRRPVTCIGLAADRISLAFPYGSAGRDNPGVMSGSVASLTLVGRLEELGVLEAAQERAANGEPAVVLVGGEAGIGKTRLIAELAERHPMEGTRVLAGGCLPVGGDGLPYAPIVEALRPLPTELGVEAVRALVGPSWSELAHLLPTLGQPPTGPTGQAAQARLFELLLGLLGRLGEQVPVVLVVEDLHWADRSTRQLLAFLVRNLRSERLLLLVTYRSDEPRPDRLGPYLAELNRADRVQRLELARLDRAATVAQLTGILGAAPAADLVEAVFVRSEGNPFFTEELLAAVRAGSGALPLTVRDLLRGRVEGLLEQPRRVLGVAAVAGRQVSHRLLAAVAGLADQQLEGALRQVVAQQLLVTKPGEDSYQFRHALLREVVEAGLLPGERARLHAGYAHALTQRPELATGAPAVAAAELAAHWDAAGELVRALPARVQAGLAAERARAFAEAWRHYERALELWEQVADPGRPAGLDRVELLARAAEAVALTGAAGEAVGLLEDALGRVDVSADPVRAAVLLARLGTHRRVAGDEAGALAALRQAEGLVSGAPPSAEVARVLAACAYGLLLRARSEQAIACSEAAIAAARAVGARAEEATALRVLAAGLAGVGGLERALELLLEARRLAEEVEDAEAVMGTYMTVGHLLVWAGREREALEDAWQGYRRARELGLDRATGSFVAGNLAFNLLGTGRWGECEQLTREALASETWGGFNLRVVRGVLLARQGEFPAAREELDLALRLSPPYLRDSAFLGQAEFALWAGRQDQAATAVAEGLRGWAEGDPDSTQTHPDDSEWYPLALRLEADRAEQAATRRASEEAAEARRRAAPLVAELDRLEAAPPPQARYPYVNGNLLLARAEQSRLEGRSDPRRWRAAALAWEQMEHPFEAAYARFREAEALLAHGSSRPQAEQALRGADRTAVALDAAPLRREIESLAKRGRLRLEDHLDKAATSKVPSPAGSLGLTRRETEVLTLMAKGRTNKQIGKQLFITEGTAGVHVSRILTKLGVASRVEAAAIAHRLELDKE
jgi:DNA-binding CsgD family transcriptional regulator